MARRFCVFFRKFVLICISISKVHKVTNTVFVCKCWIKLSREVVLLVSIILNGGKFDGGYLIFKILSIGFPNSPYFAHMRFFWSGHKSYFVTTMGTSRTNSPIYEWSKCFFQGVIYLVVLFAIPPFLNYSALLQESEKLMPTTGKKIYIMSR